MRHNEHQIKYKFPKNVNDIVLVLYEKVSREFWRIAIVLPSRGSEKGGAKVRIAKTNTILRHPVKKLFAVEIHMALTKQVRQGNKS